MGLERYVGGGFRYLERYVGGGFTVVREWWV